MEAVTDLLSICTKHKELVRAWAPLSVPQSWGQACQTQPCNVKCWLSQEARATMTRNRRNCCSPQWEIPTLHFLQKRNLSAERLPVWPHSMWNKEGRKQAGCFWQDQSCVCRVECWAELFWSHITTALQCFLHPWFWKTLKHLHNIWNVSNYKTWFTSESGLCKTNSNPK